MDILNLQPDAVGKTDDTFEVENYEDRVEEIANASANLTRAKPSTLEDVQRLFLIKKKSHEVATCRRCNSLRCTVLDKI